MKRFLSILVVAAFAAFGLSLTSCQKYAPSEITPEARQFTATLDLTVQLVSLVPVPAGTEVVFDVTDKETSATYTLKRKTDDNGNIKLNIGCGSAGVSVTVQCLVLTEATTFYGSTFFSLTPSEKFYKKLTLKIS